MAVTNYVFNPDPHLPGMLAQSGDYKARGMLNVSGGNVQFGLGVAFTAVTDEFDVINSAADATDMAGVTLFKHARLDTDTAQIVDDERADIVYEGIVYVQIDGDVNPTLPVFVRFAAGTGSVLGAFRADADTATAQQVNNARWVETATAATGIAALQLNQP